MVQYDDNNTTEAHNETGQQNLNQNTSCAARSTPTYQIAANTIANSDTTEHERHVVNSPVYNNLGTYQQNFTWTKFWTFIAALTAITALFLSIKPFILSNKQYDLAAWTAAKDYREYCESHKDTAPNLDCAGALMKPTPPPPVKWFNASTPMSRIRLLAHRSMRLIRPWDADELILKDRGFGAYSYAYSWRDVREKVGSRVALALVSTLIIGLGVYPLYRLHVTLRPFHAVSKNGR